MLDRTGIVAPEHLRAAREIWRYSVASARVIFRQGTVDRDLGRVLEALREREDGRMARSEVSRLLSHRTRDALDHLRDLLVTSGWMEAFREKGAGRPREWWVRREEN